MYEILRLYLYTKVQITWERRIQKSLESMCEEIGVNLSRYRSSADRDEMLQKWNELCMFNTSEEIYDL